MVTLAKHTKANFSADPVTEADTSIDLTIEGLTQIGENTFRLAGVQLAQFPPEFSENLAHDLTQTTQLPAHMVQEIMDEFFDAVLQKQMLHILSTRVKV